MGGGGVVLRRGRVGELESVVGRWIWAKCMGPSLPAITARGGDAGHTAPGPAEGRSQALARDANLSERWRCASQLRRVFLHKILILLNNQKNAPRG